MFVSSLYKGRAKGAIVSGLQESGISDFNYFFRFSIPSIFFLNKKKKKFRTQIRQLPTD